MNFEVRLGDLEVGQRFVVVDSVFQEVEGRVTKQHSEKRRTDFVIVDCNSEVPLCTAEGLEYEALIDVEQTWKSDLMVVCKSDWETMTTVQRVAVADLVVGDEFLIEDETFGTCRFRILMHFAEYGTTNVELIEFEELNEQFTDAEVEYRQSPAIHQEFRSETQVVPYSDSNTEVTEELTALLSNLSVGNEFIVTDELFGECHFRVRRHYDEQHWTEVELLEYNRVVDETSGGGIEYQLQPSPIQTLDSETTVSLLVTCE